MNHRLADDGAGADEHIEDTGRESGLTLESIFGKGEHVQECCNYWRKPRDSLWESRDALEDCRSKKREANELHLIFAAIFRKGRGNSK